MASKPKLFTIWLFAEKLCRPEPEFSGLFNGNSSEFALGVVEMRLSARRR